MAYTPDPTDDSQPVGTVPAGTADEEFRALKSYIKGLVLGNLQQGPDVRQVALDGVRDSNGQAAFLTAGTGLGVTVLGTATPLVLTYAQGSGVAGDLNSGESISADVANAVTLPASNRSYISKILAGAWGNTLAAPQYGYVYDRSRQSLLNFDGIPLATTFIDDFGNTWSAVSGARLQSNWTKFGATALGGAGANNILNGSSDYIQCNDITHPNKEGGSWSIRCWARTATLPGAGGAFRIAAIISAANWGTELAIYNNGGTIRFAMALSSNGTSGDIANFVQGTTLPVVGTDYFLEITYDEVAGVYRLYVNGVQEASVASALKVAAGTRTILGANSAAGGYFSGYIDAFEMLPYCDHPNGTAYSVPAAAPSITTPNYASDYFDIGRMRMYTVSAASTVAGTPPSFVTANKLYVGEVVTSGAVPTTLISYAFRRRYAIATPAQLPAVAGNVTVSHNLGVPQAVPVIEVVCVTPDLGYTVGERLPITSICGNTALCNVTVQMTRNQIGFTLNSAPYSFNKTIGSTAAMTVARWKVEQKVLAPW